MTVPTTEPAGDPMFVYGSLMSPHVLYSIIGQPDSLTPSLLSAQMYPATLHAHKRHSVRYADFPAVVKTDAPTDSVSGFLVVGLTEAQKACVDRFEGSLYTREEVQVVLEDGQKRRARVYVWAGDMEGLGAKEWSFEAFKRTGSYARWGYVEK